MSESDSIKRCHVAGCGREMHSRGMCHRHYCAARRKGLIPAPACVVAGCGRPAICRRMCGAHNHRLNRHGDPLKRKKAGNGEVKSQPCCVAGCGRGGRATHLGQVYCGVHAYRVKSHGDPHTVKKLGNGQATEERKKRQAAERQRRYLATPHGKLRSRFNSAKARVRLYGCDHASGIPKDVWLALHAQTHCGICRLPFAPGGVRTIDHILPLSRGGANDPANLQMAHDTCNFEKNNRG